MTESPCLLADKLLYPLLRQRHIFLFIVVAYIVSPVFEGGQAGGAAPAEGIKDHIPFKGIELNQPMGKFLGEGGGVVVNQVFRLGRTTLTLPRLPRALGSNLHLRVET